MTAKVRVFVDASVLFAAAYSKTGYARDLLRLAIREQVVLVVSQDVLDEVERNLARKAPEALTAFKHLLLLLGLEVVGSPSKKEIEDAEAYVARKDAMIVAAAIKATVDYLVTYDRKHLLDPPEVAGKSGLTIITPDVVVLAIRERDDREE